MEQRQVGNGSTHSFAVEKFYNISALILILVVFCESIVLLFSVKNKASSTNIFHLSLTISSIFFSLSTILHLCAPNLILLPHLLNISLVASISFSTLISLDKMISLALPFYYSSLVTQASTSKITILAWILAVLLPLVLLMMVDPLEYKLTIITFESVLLLIAVSCQVYIWKVAHRHAQKIQKTQESAHQSVHRLNSLRDSIYSGRNSVCSRRDSIALQNTDHTVRRPATLMSSVDICSPNQTTTTVFFSPDPLNSANLDNSVNISNVLSKNSLMLVLSPISLLFGWTPYLSWSLYQAITFKSNELEVEFLLPLLLLMAVGPLIHGKLKGKAGLLLFRRNPSKIESLPGSPRHGSVSPDNKSVSNMMIRRKSYKNEKSCRFFVTLPTPSAHEAEFVVSIKQSN